MLEKLLKAIKGNKTIRNKTKLILCSYRLNAAFDMEYEPYVNQMVVEKFPQEFTTTGYSFLHRPKPKWIPPQRPVCAGDITESDADLLNDHQVFRQSNADHTLLMQLFTKNHVDIALQMESIAQFLSYNPLMPVNGLSMIELMSDFILQASANVDYYFYSINPALAIIFNSFSFKTDLRKGSEENVRRIIQELKVINIPFVLIQDCTTQEFINILQYLKHGNFAILKTLMLFLMSHGGMGDLIYTIDGQIHLIEDVVKPLQANNSLANVEKIVVGNFCRGSIDYEEDPISTLKEVKPSFYPNLSGNFTMMFSVPNLVKSPRCTVEGSPFVETFCQLLRIMEPHEDLRKVKQKNR
uniref:Caspase family p20 domain-containing protein n=1 Tax=Musca domestica TaxID=7370 RepID=T1P9A0_MUSDO